MTLINPESQIKLLFEVIEEDRKHVMLYVVICFTIPAFSVAQLKIADTPLIVRCVLILALLSFIISGINYFYYTQAIHWHRLMAAREALEKGPEEVRNVLMGERGVWTLNKQYFKRGGWWLLVAAVLYVLFFSLHLFSKEIFS